MVHICCSHDIQKVTVAEGVGMSDGGTSDYGKVQKYMRKTPRIDKSQIMESKYRGPRSDLTRRRPTNSRLRHNVIQSYNTFICILLGCSVLLTSIK